MSSESDSLFNICDALVTAVENDVLEEKKKKKKKRPVTNKKNRGKPDLEDYGEKPTWLASLEED
jgi:hypothetical protein